MDADVCLFEPTNPYLACKGLAIADAVVGNGDGEEVMMVVTNLGMGPVQLEVGDVLGGLHPVLAVDDFSRSTDSMARGSEDICLKENSTRTDALNTTWVATVRSNDG